MTKEILFAAAAKLKAAGWIHTHSVMAERRPGETNYGMHFSGPNAGERFYLNKDTIDKLPV